MTQIEHTIEVAVPTRQAYDQWTQFETFPLFMEGVESVTQLDDTHLHWVATVAGRRQEWDAEITEQVPDRRITWHSTAGDRNAGEVTFQRIGEERTRITLTMGVKPSGVVEKVGAAIGIPSAQVKGDLERFKDLVESRARASAGWRGEVHEGDVTRDDSGHAALGSTESGSAAWREPAGAGAMGMTGTGSDLGGQDVGMPGGVTPTEASGLEATSTTFDTGAGTAASGDSGSGMPNRDDLGTGRRVEDRDL